MTKNGVVIIHTNKDGVHGVYMFWAKEYREKNPKSFDYMSEVAFGCEYFSIQESVAGEIFVNTSGKLIKTEVSGKYIFKNVDRIELVVEHDF